MAAINVDPVLLDLGAVLVPVGAVGGAVLLIYVLLQAWRWLMSTVDAGGVDWDAHDEADRLSAARTREDVMGREW